MLTTPQHNNNMTKENTEIKIGDFVTFSTIKNLTLFGTVTEIKNNKTLTVQNVVTQGSTPYSFKLEIDVSSIINATKNKNWEKDLERGFTTPWEDDCENPKNGPWGLVDY